MDEAGINPGAKALTVAGYLGRPTQRIKFTKEWNRVLKPTGLSSYHATDAQALKGEFKGWKEGDVIDLCKKLLPIIPRHARGISATIVMKDFNEAFADKKHLLPTLGTPYAACFQWVVQKLLMLSQDVSATPRTAVVHERNDMQKDATDAYNWLKKTKDYDNQLVSLTFGNDIDFVPLQAADILAFEAGRRIANPNNPDRIAWKVLNPPGAQCMALHYSKNNMHKLVASMQQAYDANERFKKSKASAKQ